MVDALNAVHRAIRPKGILLDIRPSADLEPRVEVDGRVVGRLVPGDLGQDRAADDAVLRLTAAGLYEHRRAGHFWHRFSFATLAEFDRWREGTRRFPRYEGDRLPPRSRITVRRAIAFIEYRRP